MSCLYTQATIAAAGSTGCLEYAVFRYQGLLGAGVAAVAAVIVYRGQLSVMREQARAALEQTNMMKRAAAERRGMAWVELDAFLTVLNKFGDMHLTQDRYDGDLPDGYPPRAGGFDWIWQFPNGVGPHFDPRQQPEFNRQHLLSNCAIACPTYVGKVGDALTAYEAWSKMLDEYDAAGRPGLALNTMELDNFLRDNLRDRMSQALNRVLATQAQLIAIIPGYRGRPDVVEKFGDVEAA